MPTSPSDPPYQTLSYPPPTLGHAHHPHPTASTGTLRWDAAGGDPRDKTYSKVIPFNKARVHYRAMSTKAGSSITRDVEAYYCGCHDENSVDPKNPTMLSEKDCTRDNCPDDYSPTFTDLDKDIGYQRLIWEGVDSLLPGGLSCPPHDSSDIGTHDNECDTDIPNRLFWKPYGAGSSVTGAKPGDSAKFWAMQGRTASFVWDWRRQDYPNKGLAASPYNPDPPIGGARVRIMLRPKAVGGEKVYESFGPIMDLNAGQIIDTHFQALLPWPSALEAWRVPQPADYKLPSPGPFPDPGPRMLRPLVTRRDGTAAFAWLTPSPSSATVGLMVVAYDPVSGRCQDALPSRTILGEPLDTLGFATARLGDRLYVFGGQNGLSELSSRLWVGQAGQDASGQDAFLWSEIAASGPTARKDAILVGDAGQNRLVLLFGSTDQGATADAEAFDVASQSWTPLTIQHVDPQPRTAAGYAAQGTKVYFYGGHNATGDLDGLFVLDLNTLTTERLDLPGAGPGPRSQVALGHDATTRRVYLAGGLRGSQRQNDLWAFDLDTMLWVSVSDGSEPHGPLPMASGAVLASPVDGAVTVLSGSTSAADGQPLWRYTQYGWQTYDNVLGYQQ